MYLRFLKPERLIKLKSFTFRFDFRQTDEQIFAIVESLSQLKKQSVYEYS